MDYVCVLPSRINSTQHCTRRPHGCSWGAFFRGLVHKQFINCSWKLSVGWTRKGEQTKSKRKDEEEDSSKRERTGRREDKEKTNRHVLINCSWIVHNPTEAWLTRSERKTRKRRMRGKQPEAKERRQRYRRAGGQKDWGAIATGSWRSDMVTSPGGTYS